MTAPAAISPWGAYSAAAGRSPRGARVRPRTQARPPHRRWGGRFLKAATERRSGCTAPLGSRRREMPPQRAVQPLLRRPAPPGRGVGLAAGPAKSGRTAGIRPIGRSAKPNTTYDTLHTSGTGVRASPCSLDAKRNAADRRSTGQDQGDAGASRTAARGEISSATRLRPHTTRCTHRTAYPLRRTSGVIPHATRRKHRAFEDTPRTAAARPPAAYRVPQTSLATPRASRRTP